MYEEDVLDFDVLDFETPDCPACGGPGVELGALGKLKWYRCRNCGIEFNVEVS